MKIRRRALKFYGYFAAALGTLWLGLFVAAYVTQSRIDARIYVLYAFPAVALFYAIVRSFMDSKRRTNDAEQSPRFTLRGLFIVIAFAALLCGWWRDHWRLRNFEAISPRLLEDSRARFDAEAESLQGIANLLDAPVGYERLVGIGDLRYVHSVKLPQVTMTDRQIGPLVEHLRDLPRLTKVVIGQTPLLSPAQVDKLQASLPNVGFTDVLWSTGSGGVGRIQQYPNKVYPKDGASPTQR